MTDPSRKQQTREEIARIEVGRTTVSAGVARFLLAFFLAAMAIVPLIQHGSEVAAHLAGKRASALPQAYDILRVGAEAVERLFSPGSGALPARVFATNRLLLKGMNDYEHALDDASLVGQAVRPHVQHLLSGWLGVGNEKAYCGRRPWLFYRPGVDYVTGPGFLAPRQLARRAAGGSEWVSAPQPDPAPAIVDFRDSLQARGIALVVFPTPDKAMVQPERLSRKANLPGRLLQNPSYRLFREILEREKIPVFDAANLLAAKANNGARPLYLATDTHWRPETMADAAEALARFLEDRVGLPARPPLELQARPRDIAGEGDLAVMLKLPPDQKRYPRETICIREIRDPEGRPWQPDPAADVLLLGDSFANIYSLGGMGWGEAAGLAEQLSFALRRPVDRIARNDNGAFATRETLAQELARGNDRLAGKTVVVWQFAIRELAAGDWKPVALPSAGPASARFLTLAPGQERTVRGRLQSVSFVPRPGTVPYKDHVMTLHLVQLKRDGRRLPEGEAVVYVQSMADNVLTPAARLRPGQVVDIRLRSWQDVASRYEGMNRSEADDEALALVEPVWGELVR